MSPAAIAAAVSTIRSTGRKPCLIRNQQAAVAIAIAIRPVTRTIRTRRALASSMSRIEEAVIRRRLSGMGVINIRYWNDPSWDGTVKIRPVFRALVPVPRSGTAGGDSGSPGYPAYSAARIAPFAETTRCT